MDVLSLVKSSKDVYFCQVNDKESDDPSSITKLSPKQG